MISVPSPNSWIQKVPRLARFELKRGSKPQGETGFEEAIDLLVLFVEAGLPLTLAMRESAKVVTVRHAELGNLLETTAGELELDPDRNAVLNRLAEKLRSPDAKAAVRALAEALRYGAPPVKALRDVAKALFEASVQKQQKRLACVPALAVVPLVLFAIPCILFLAWHYLTHL
jgi:pilus assembly protein TadC